MVIPYERDRTWGTRELEARAWGQRAGRAMSDKADVWQGTLALMVLKTLEALGPLHGYGIARRIEQTSAHHLALNYGTLYPALLKLEQEGYIASEWGVSDNNRRRSSIASHALDGSNSRRKCAIGSERRPSSPAS